MRRLPLLLLLAALASSAAAASIPLRVDRTTREAPVTFGVPFPKGALRSPDQVRGTLFRLLARINKSLLPKQWDRDLSRLPKWRKALAAYRYWVTRNALD